MRATDRILGLLCSGVRAIMRLAGLQCSNCKELVSALPPHHTVREYFCKLDRGQVDPDCTLCKHFERR